MTYPAPIESTVPRAVLAERDSPRALVLIVRADGAGRPRPGLAFVADVLRANGLRAMPFSLDAPDEHVAGGAKLGMVQAKHRLRSVLDGLAALPGMCARPVALIGVGGAAAACAAVAARQHPLSLCSLVLLDGRPKSMQHHLSHLTLPTLFVVSQCDERCLMQHRSALRKVTAPHRLALLPHRTWPTVEPGALEAFACAAVSWLSRTLPAPADAATGQAGPKALHR